MNLQVVPDYQVLSLSAAQRIAEEIRRNPRIVLGLAAGNTPSGTYRELVRMHHEENLDFSEVRFFNLDEFAGLKASDPRSFTAFLHRSLLDHIHVKPTNVHLLRFPAASSIDEYCASFEQEIAEEGGIDLQILGIGRNGHIAFNEPGSSFKSRTRAVTLSRQDLPSSSAITMGIATILDARRILLLASGKEKAESLAKAIEGPVTEDVPASALQLHADVTVIADEDGNMGTGTLFLNYKK